MLSRSRPPAGFIETCLPTLAREVPGGPLWVHEIKHDGYRFMGAWRRDEATGQYYGLLITDAGCAAINAEDDGKAGEQPPKQPRAAQPAAKLGQPPLGAGRKAAKQKAAKAGTRDGSSTIVKTG